MGLCNLGGGREFRLRKLIADLLTGYGVSTSVSANADTIAANIQTAHDTAASDGYASGVSDTKVGTASAARVLTGYTFTNSSSVGISGTMSNRGAVSKSLNCGESYTVPIGYHNGSGKVTAASLASQTDGAAEAADIAKNRIVWVKGYKIVGTQPDYRSSTTAAVGTISKGSNSDYSDANMNVAGIVASNTKVNAKPAYDAGLSKSFYKSWTLSKSNHSVSFTCEYTGTYDLYVFSPGYIIWELAVTSGGSTISQVGSYGQGADNNSAGAGQYEYNFTAGVTYTITCGRYDEFADSGNQRVFLNKR